MRKFVAIQLLALILAACAAPAATPSATVSNNDEPEVRRLVEDFGATLQEVSLLAPDSAEQIRDKYADFVSEELLTAWTADPASAPGRLTSSPWPDRIEISAVERQGDGGYRVTGSVIEVTSVEAESGGVAAQYPVEVTVSQIDGAWRITGWTAGEYQF